ncbi:MAG: uroporphyrinogen decarboxylase family protein [Dehalococcoidales bacterium]
MNARERFQAIVNFKEADRNFLWEFGYWTSTVRRWYGEGLPLVKGLSEGLADGTGLFAESAGVPLHRETAHDVHDYFKFDPYLERVPLNIGAFPEFEQKVIEDHGAWYIWQTEDGCLRKELKNRTSLPTIVGGPVKTRDDWERFKAERLQPVLEGRLPDNWPQLVEAYKKRDYPLGLGQTHGFFGTPRYLMGVEELLTKFYDDPEMMRDMNLYLADFWIALFGGVLKEVAVDTVFIWEDMCYRGGPLISPEMFREFILPGYRKLTGFLKDNGIKDIQVDSDGDVWKLLPLWIEGGVTTIYPFEVAAGMDIVAVRKAFPGLGIAGGLDKRALIRGREAIDRELESKVPFMLEQGGYIPTIDHMVSPDISLGNFKYYRQKLEEIIKRYSRTWDRD